MHDRNQGHLFVRQHTHASGLPTEEAAAEQAAIRAGSIKDQIVCRLLEEGERGLTPDEFCEEIHGLINTVRRRFTDLWKEGKVRHHPEAATRENAAGNACVVWVLGRDDNITPSRIESLLAEISRLRRIIELHGLEWEV